MKTQNFYYETERLILRHATEEDADILASKRSCSFVTRYNLYQDCDGEQIKRELGKYEHILLVLKSSREIIGCVSVRDDYFRYRIDSKCLYAWLTEDMAYQGFMLEALQVIMAKLFYLNGHERIAIQIFSENTASLRLARKLGFEEEGYLKRGLKNHLGQVYDVVLLSLDRESFIEQHYNPFS